MVTNLATHCTTHQGARQRTGRRSTCRHGHAWIGRIAKAIGHICEKHWGNQGLGTERTGREQPTKSMGKSKFQNEAAQNPTRAAKQAAHEQRIQDPTVKGLLSDFQMNCDRNDLPRLSTFSTPLFSRPAAGRVLVRKRDECLDAEQGIGRNVIPHKSMQSSNPIDTSMVIEGMSKRVNFGRVLQ